VADWRGLSQTRNVVAVPFFISDGLHSYEDIPALLGISRANSASGSGGLRPSEISEDGGHGNRRSLRSQDRTHVFRGNPYQIDNRLLFYAPAIGTDARFAEIIVAQTLQFES
jgi:sirohydrochlorin cobaltochelatase